MSNNLRDPLPHSIEHLEARFALRVTARLNESADYIPNDVTERLRVARQQALQKAIQMRAAAHTPLAVRTWNWGLVFSGGGTGQGGPSSWWSRAVIALPLIVLIAGLLGIQELHSSRLISAAAEIDAALLSDDLPPDAYQDAGFLEFLKRPPTLE